MTLHAFANRLFAPFEGKGPRYPIAIFRLAFFAGLCIHFFPTLINLSGHYDLGSLRTNEWNRWLFDRFGDLPHSALRALSVLTMAACLTGFAGIAPRVSALVAGVGLYSFSSFNGLGIQTLALIPTWAILALWSVLGGGNAVLSLPSRFRRFDTGESRLLPSLITFQILLAVFFSGLEKMLVGWPGSDDLRILFCYPPDSFVRNWIPSCPILQGPLAAGAFSLATVLVEIGTPLLLLWKRTRMVALVAYEIFFVSIIATLSVPPLFFLIFAFGGLLVLDDCRLSACMLRFKFARRPRPLAD
jgi:hypothetical protein